MLRNFDDALDLQHTARARIEPTPEPEPALIEPTQVDPVTEAEVEGALAHVEPEPTRTGPEPVLAYQGERVSIWYGDVLDTLRAMSDASVDSIVTDPPYGLSATDPTHVTQAIKHWVTGDRAFLPTGRGFMGKEWDSFVPPPAVWDECYRVLKPGGHLLSFAGSRTQDLMGLSIRLAGFDMRDSIAWLYGSGFPKSLDVSKAIDKAGGASPAEQARILHGARLRAGLSREEVAEAVGCTPASVRDWEDGRARAKGRAIEYVTPSPTYRERLADLLGYTVDERRAVGVSVDRRGDGTVLGLGHAGVRYDDAPATEQARRWQGWGTALKPAFEPIVVARKPLAGTVAANVLAHGTGALNIDATRIDAEPDLRMCGTSEKDGDILGFGARRETRTSSGRWPANVVLSHADGCEQVGTTTERVGGGAKMSKTGQATVEFGGGYARGDGFVGKDLTAPIWQCVEGCPVGELDAQSGITRDGVAVKRNGVTPNGVTGWGKAEPGTPDAGGYGGQGGASRFFPVFKYQAKAPKKERPAVEVDGKKVQHPTVKPLGLMDWLVRLVTPPDGVVLDPFLGSGTTAESALRQGFRCIGIEREAEYLPLIMARVERVEGQA